MGNFVVSSFGCRASQADGAALESELVQKGLHVADQTVEPDWVVLNTCTVTSTAEADLRQIVRRTHQQHPSARIAITGCYAQRSPDELAALPGVALVVGNSHKQELAQLIANADPSYHGQVHVGDIFAQESVFTSASIDLGPDRTRPNLKIQDGCNNRCSFCIIPFVRGRSRSLPPDQIVAQVRELGSRYREVVLTGINLGRWGREAGLRMRLHDLVRRLLVETPIERLRLSSVEPMDWTDELIGLMAESPRIAQHVHAPLQSGSDRVLRRMHRRYRPRHYVDRIEKAFALMPDAAFGADVLVGFPGETEAEFQETRALLERLPFTYLHVFSYSERPGTPAAAAKDQVPMGLRRERNRELQALASAKNRQFRERMVGRNLSAVTLREPGMALTSNFLKVEMSQRREPNQLVELKIGSVSAHHLRETGMLNVL